MPEQIRFAKFIIIVMVMVGFEPTPAANAIGVVIVSFMRQKVKKGY